MEDEEESEDASEFPALKRRKNNQGFTGVGGSPQETKQKNKRSLPLSLKSSRSKNKGHGTRRLENVRILERDHLRFCPACQVPFTGLVGQSAQGHVQECLENAAEVSARCPDGINCNSISVQHFKRFSHQQLANLRSIKESNISANQEKNEKENKIYAWEGNAKTTDKVLPGEKYECMKNTEHSTWINNEDIHDNNSSYDTRGNCIVEQTSSMTENNTDIITGPAVGLSEKECVIVDKNDGCPIEISQWLNDNFEMEDFELDNGSCSSVMNNSDTNSSNHTCSLSSNVQTYTNSQSMSNVTRQKTENKKQTTAMKQMDIGVFFGLKPKQEVNKVRTEVPSGEIPSKNYAANQDRTTSGRAKQKKCPFYKIVEGTSFAVDAFSYGNVLGVTAYFLSHFHYDHYGGLNKHFSHPIYCSQITANLISLKIKVASQFIHPLPLHSPVNIENVEVILLEANHCPGAVMFLFKLPNGKTHLHTGDFRASSLMEVNPFLCSSSIHTLYLDTTYCDPDYSFPPQSDTVDYCASLAKETVAKNAKTLIVVGAYTIGKEKIFIAVADALQSKVGVRRDKDNVLQCLESEHLKEIITQNYNNAQVHVLPMADLTHKKLCLHLKNYISHYCEVLAIKPTGWTSTDCQSDLTNIKPSKRGAVTIYGVPYSEHSSFKELEKFVKFIKPYKIIPTVNNGSARKRDQMNRLFRTWLKK